jgi:Tfp pilus assembly protein PilF
MHLKAAEQARKAWRLVARFQGVANLKADTLAACKEELPGVLNSLATHYLRMKELEMANATWTESLQADPERAETFVGIATLRCETRDLSGAEELLRIAIALDHMNVKGLTCLGVLREIQGDIQGAEDSFRRAFQADDSCSILVAAYAHHLHTLRRDCVSAEALYKRCLPSLAPALSGAHYVRSRNPDRKLNHEK